MLKDALEIYRMLSVKSVLVSCDKQNEASRRTIKNCGGKLLREFYSDVFDTMEMYSIDVS